MATTASTKSTISNNLSWIHCNVCFEIYIKKERTFFILSCRHVACEKCLQSNTLRGTFSYKCPVTKCGKNVRGHQIGNTLTPHIKELFYPQPWLDNLPAGNIMKFQLKHEQHLCQKHRNMLQKIPKAQKYLQIERQRVKQKHEESKKLDCEEKRLEQCVKEIKKPHKRAKTAGNVTIVSTSTCDESVNASGPVFHNGIHGRTSHGRGQLIPASYPHNITAYGRGRVPYATAVPMIQSFEQNHNKSFNL